MSSLREQLSRCIIENRSVDGSIDHSDQSVMLDELLAALQTAVLAAAPKIVNDLETIKRKNAHLDQRMQDMTLAESSGYIKAVEAYTRALQQLFESEG